MEEIGDTAQGGTGEGVLVAPAPEDEEGIGEVALAAPVLEEGAAATPSGGGAGNFLGGGGLGFFLGAVAGLAACCCSPTV